MAVSRLVVVLASCLVSVKYSHAFSSGAPEMSCDNMMPSHGVEGHQSNPPYHVTTSTTAVKPGDQIEVTLSGNVGFKGFFVRARQRGVLIGGTFQQNSFGSLRCNGQGITHSNNKVKNNVKVMWTSPADLRTSSIQFQVTFVQERTVFWTAVTSADVAVDVASVTTGTSSTHETTAAASIERRPSFPASGTGLPGRGAIFPGSGTSNPGRGTHISRDGVSDHGSGTSFPGSGTSNPESGTNISGGDVSVAGSGTSFPGSDSSFLISGTNFPPGNSSTVLGSDSNLSGSGPRIPSFTMIGNTMQDNTISSSTETTSESTTLSQPAFTTITARLDPHVKSDSSTPGQIAPNPLAMAENSNGGNIIQVGAVWELIMFSSLWLYISISHALS